MTWPSAAATTTSPLATAGEEVTGEAASYSQTFLPRARSSSWTRPSLSRRIRGRRRFESIPNSLNLAPLQEPSAFKYRGHRLFDSRRSRRRLLGRGKVVQVTPLSPRRQRVEGALETRVPSEPLPQLLGNWKI